MQYAAGQLLYRFIAIVWCYSQHLAASRKAACALLDEIMVQAVMFLHFCLQGPVIITQYLLSRDGHACTAPG